MVREVLNLIEAISLEEVVDGVALVTEEGLPAGSKGRSVDPEELAGIGYTLLKSARKVCGSLGDRCPNKAFAKVNGMSVVARGLRNGWCLVVASRSAPLGYLSKVAEEARGKVEEVLPNA